MEIVIAKTSSELGLKVKLPIQDEDIKKVFETLKYTSAVSSISARIIQADGEIKSLNLWLRNKEINTKSIRELNLISDKIEFLSQTEKVVFCCAIEKKQPKNLKEIIDILKE